MNDVPVNFEICVTSGSGRKALLATFDLLPKSILVVGYRLVEDELLFLYHKHAKGVILFPAPMNSKQTANMAYNWLNSKYKSNWIPKSSDGIYEERGYGWHFRTRGQQQSNLAGHPVGTECLGLVYPTVMKYSSSS